MAEDWLADVRKYDSQADENVVAAIVRHCGIALRSRDASLVSFSDSKETDRVRESFLKKKLALTDDDATLDAAIAAVGTRMQADRTKNRVTVYYLLAEHFDLLDLFGGTKRGSTVAGASAGAAAAVAGTAPLAAMSSAAAEGTAAAGNTAGVVYTPESLAGGHPPAQEDDNDIFGFGCLVAAGVLAAFLLAAVVAYWLDLGGTPEEAPVAATPATTAPAAPAATAPAAAAAVPAGAGVVADQRDDKPMLTVYFDTGKSDVAPEFAEAAAPVLAYLEANPDASLQISGFNDPTGNAALNAELSKNRAQSVQAALVGLGVDEARTELVKPDDTTGAGASNEEARRVEVTIVE